MSYELKISQKDRASGRFMGKVHRALVEAAIREKHESGVSQREIAAKLGVNRSMINRILRGDTNLTIKTIAEVAWALGWEPDFSMKRKTAPKAGHNHFKSSRSAVDRPRTTFPNTVIVNQPRQDIETSTTSVNLEVVS
ncbi:helix-turn-helix transcriptional regulator [Mesorhizobium sp. VK25A]|uniref:Helix-turn-helix transcriptional regulator n=1 Tax=Mesorhizobium vachelliae TaxID=3072309 RepID=A0ABU5A9Q8_9HYPH|nr:MULTISPECIES: helix-turn-helix transcriptional regulator [unclassified Mesorhizobium]MDX8534302.1 helix-turn-helix transcriptional regulator [Mesorhizobium sp. VK25D]MDX8546944.1 helix-turn-helix transcriptional regulator [Mesorhizobium sp. VK25A]